jgi:hypothetical protein
MLFVPGGTVMGKLEVRTFLDIKHKHCALVVLLLEVEFPFAFACIYLRVSKIFSARQFFPHVIIFNCMKSKTCWTQWRCRGAIS